MCNTCWDLDCRSKLEEEGVDCSGTDLFKTTLVKMKEILENRWKKNRKTHYRINSDSVIDFHHPTISWTAVDPRTHETATLSIEFSAA